MCGCLFILFCEEQNAVMEEGVLDLDEVGPIYSACVLYLFCNI